MSDDEQMNDGQKVFLGVLVFLVLKGLLDPKDADDKERVRKTWKRVKNDAERDPDPSLWSFMKPR